MKMTAIQIGHGIRRLSVIRSSRLLLTFVSLFLATSLSAQSLTWDANGTTTGLTDGAGTWNTTNTNWWNGTSNVSWNNTAGNIAIFGNGGTLADPASATINVSGTVQVGGLQFNAMNLATTNSRSYILTGGTISLATGSTIRLLDGSSNTTTGRITLTSVLSGNNISILGGGTNGAFVTLNGINTWTGTLTLANVAGSGYSFVNIGHINSISTLDRIEVKNTNSLVIGYGQTQALQVPLSLEGTGVGNRGAIRFDQSRTLSGPVTLTGNTSVSVSTTTVTGTIDGNIGESGGSRSFTINTNNTVGTIILGGNNTFTGGAIINAGELRLDSGNALNSTAPNTVTFSSNTNAKTLSLNGYSTTVNGIVSAATNNNALVQNASTTAATLTIRNTGTHSSHSIFADGTGGGSLSLIKAGSGTQILTNSSTYTGSTTVAEGTLHLNFGGSSAAISSILSGSSALVMSGGTLLLSGSSTIANSQTFNGLTIAEGKSTISLVTNATAQNLVLNLGTITALPGGTINFILPTRTQSATNGILTTNTNNAAGILGAWATVNGTDWATVSGGNIVAYTGYQEITNFSTGAGSVGPLPNNPNANVKIINGGTSGNIVLGNAGGTTDINTLIHSGSGAAIIGSVSGDILRLGTSGGIMQSTGAGDLTIGTTVNGGVLTAGGTVSGTPGQLIFTATATGQTTTVNSTIANNGTAGTVSVIKNGPGTLVLSSTNSTYTGGTFFNGGTILAMAERSLGNAPTSVQAANLTFNGGTLQWGSAFNLNTNRGITLQAGGGTLDVQTFSSTYAGKITGTGSLTKLGNGTLTLSGANDYTGVTNISAGIVVVSNNQALGTTAGGTTVGATAILRLTPGITVTGETLTLMGLGNNQGNLQVQGGAATWAGDVLIGAANSRIGTGSGGILTISGNIRDAGGSELGISAQNGTVILSGANTYTGPTTLIRGVLRLGADNTLPSTTLLSLFTNTVVEETVSMDLYGYDQTVAGLRHLVVSNLDNVSVTNSQSGAPSVFTVNQTTNQTYSGKITGNLELVKDGSGTLTLTNTYNQAAPVATTNTYTGKTTIRGGTLALSGTGNLEGTPWIQVDSGATFSISGRTGGSYTLNNQVLSGSGSINGHLIVSGTSRVSPGSSSGLLANAGDGYGTLSFNDLTLSGNGLPTLRMTLQLGGTNSNAAGGNPVDFANADSGGLYDSVEVAGSLNLNAGSTIRVELATGYTPQLGDVFNLFDWASINVDADGSGGAGAWTIADLDLSAANALLGNGWYFETNQFLQHGLIYIAVPEPSRMLLLVVGMIAVFGKRRRH